MSKDSLYEVTVEVKVVVRAPNATFASTKAILAIGGVLGNIMTAPPQIVEHIQTMGRSAKLINGLADAPRVAKEIDDGPIFFSSLKE